MKRILFFYLLPFVFTLTTSSRVDCDASQTTYKSAHNTPKIDNNFFECYTDFVTEELLLKCQWTDKPCVLTFKFEDTQGHKVYKMEQAVATGTQNLRFDIKAFAPGPYRICVINLNNNNILNLIFVKVK